MLDGEIAVPRGKAAGDGTAFLLCKSRDEIVRLFGQRLDRLGGNRIQKRQIFETTFLVCVRDELFRSWAERNHEGRDGFTRFKQRVNAQALKRRVQLENNVMVAFVLDARKRQCPVRNARVFHLPTQPLKIRFERIRKRSGPTERLFNQAAVYPGAQSRYELTFHDAAPIRRTVYTTSGGKTRAAVSNGQPALHRPSNHSPFV